MDPQELCLVLKGVSLAKESRQTVAVLASTFDKHKLDCYADNLHKHLIGPGDGSNKNEYHSMWLLDRRHCHKRLEYFASLCQDDQAFQAYLDSIADIGKDTSPACLVIAGIEFLLKYLDGRLVLRLMEAIQACQSKNLRSPL